MNRFTPFLLSGVLLFGTVACNNVAKNSAEAPDSTTSVGEAPDAQTAQRNQKDATSDLRRRQLNADIQAREQRNDAGGDDAERADGDLQSEVRSKLEANLPASNLAVDAKDGAVTISGTVPTPQQRERVVPLAKEIKGVQSVNISNVKVVQATEQ